jgi:class 3 adenylate cyclase
VRRKTVTVLFCDVTGSTALGERLDPESFRLVMRRYFDTARRVIEHHGGTVEKFIGDAVMAVFGVPVLHEDDALRAVRAATGLREEIAVLNLELEADFGTTVTVRTGVNTGGLWSAQRSGWRRGTRSTWLPAWNRRQRQARSSWVSRRGGWCATRWLRNRLRRSN